MRDSFTVQFEISRAEMQYLIAYKDFHKCKTLGDALRRMIKGASR